MVRNGNLVRVESSFVIIPAIPLLTQTLHAVKFTAANGNFSELGFAGVVGCYGVARPLIFVPFHALSDAIM